MEFYYPSSGAGVSKTNRSADIVKDNKVHSCNYDEYSLVDNKVYYRIFDKYFQQSSDIYVEPEDKDIISLAEITQNRQKIVAELRADKLLVLKQVHGTIVLDVDNLIVDNAIDFASTPVGDAAVTTKTGIALSIQTADCVPVLITTIDGGVIAAVHCGWRGAKEDIVARAVELIQKKSSAEIIAVIGPSIQQPSYEVSEDFYQNFLDDNAEFKKFFIPSTKYQHYLFNLPAFVYYKLNASNVNIIKMIAEDTYSNQQKYHSYRRFNHQENGKYQKSGGGGELITTKSKLARMLSTIVLR